MVEYKEKEGEESTVDVLKKWVDRHSIQLVRKIDLKTINYSLKLNTPVVIVRTSSVAEGQLI